ncbi:PQ-loop repeat-containing protein 1 [Vanrija pseudolonga]|uniref:PQ-loop repeat-containing protein 1 n=1 Tax=Vanrija pseudolonga TaxID=143232 RepID=A0AAF1BP16_9TREE|nr:PQ-loop repeat-containing protein 1 [Vanrija pseudolonga]
MGFEAVVGTLASVGMAVGPPLVYVDQAYSIIKKRDSSGFSHDVCGVIIIACTIRVFFWLGEHFETPLLVQALLLIISQLALLWICLYYSPQRKTKAVERDDEAEGDEETDRTAFLPEESAAPEAPAWRRPFNFWQWDNFGSYLEFLAGLIVVLSVLQFALGRFRWYPESTLPVPQFISNFRRKSCYGFRSTTLAGWLFGDTFKTGYYFIRNNPLQFKVTGLMTICWDIGVLIQRIYYGAEKPANTLALGDDAGDERALTP